MDTPAVKSAKGHVAHYEKLVKEWTHRRDQGDCVPDRETLTKWITQAEADLKAARLTLERAETKQAEGLG